jgi:hypothetical protein
VPVCLSGAGKFTRHVDIWDSVNNNEYFSFEAFADVLRQLGNLSHASAGLEALDYTVMKKLAHYEIRRCVRWG